MTRSEALEMLKSWGACRAGIDRVKDARTIELMIVRASLSDLEWVIEQIGGKTRVTYNAAIPPAWAARDAAIAPAWAAHAEAVDTAWAAYEAATDSWAAHAEAVDTAWAATYDAATAPALAAYNTAIASAHAAYNAATAPAQAACHAVRLEIARKIVTAYVGGAR
jgi:hypothetical protein